MLGACTIQDGNGQNAGNYYFKISSKRIKSKEVEVIPWIIGDSNCVKLPSQKLDPTKTVFVGALHGKLTAEGLAVIMHDLFEGVVYAGMSYRLNFFFKSDYNEVNVDVNVRFMKRHYFFRYRHR